MNTFYYNYEDKKTTYNKNILNCISQNLTHIYQLLKNATQQQLKSKRDDSEEKQD